MQLSDFMALRGLKDDDVAQAISRARATVSRYRRRKILPDWDTRERIKQFTDGSVTDQDWAEIARNRLVQSEAAE
jgi:hypothetical protein